MKDSASPTVINGADYDSFASDALLYNITGEALRKAGLKRFGLYRNETETCLTYFVLLCRLRESPRPAYSTFFFFCNGNTQKTRAFCLITFPH